MEMRHQPFLFGDNAHQDRIGLDGIDRGQPQALHLRHQPQQLFHQGPQRGRCREGRRHRRSGPPPSARSRRSPFRPGGALRPPPHPSARCGNCPRPNGMMQKVQRWSQPFCTCRKARVWPSKWSTIWGAVSRTLMMSLTWMRSPPPIAEIGIAVGDELFLVAQHRIHFRHGGIGLGLDLRRAARDQDGAAGIFALQPADRLARLAHRFGRHRAGIDHHRVAQLRLAGAGLDRLALIGIEAAAEGDDFDRHGRDVIPACPGPPGRGTAWRWGRSSAHDRLPRAIRC